MEPLTQPDCSLTALIEAVRSIEYGRPSDRSVEGMLRERRGTCSTKHLYLLKQLAQRFPETKPEIVHRVYRLDRDRARELFGDVVPDAGVMDVHRYLTATLDGRRIIIDATFPGAPWDGRSSMPALEADHCDSATREQFISALVRLSGSR